MQRMAKFVIAAIPVWLAGCGFGGYEGLGPLDLKGVVVGSEPVAGATVRVWKVGELGTNTIGLPIATATTDERGRFELHLEVEHLPLRVTASGGVTSEYWTSDTYALDGDDNDPSVRHYEAVITRFRRDESERSIVVSPVTTIIKGLADRRFALGMDASYAASVAYARGLFDEHFDLDVDVTIPSRPPNASMTPEVRHGLVLAGLADVARDIAERSGYSVNAMNTWILTGALVKDALGPRALLDGIADDGGEPITFDDCSPPCALSGDTLRTELVRHLVAGFLRSAQNDTGLDYRDMGEWLRHLMESDVPELFPGPAGGQLDDSPPVIQVLPSPVADERYDFITFDENATPIHEHTSLTSDLAAGFDGAECPAIYKHVNTMWDPTDNPIRVRFVVLDDLGVAEDEISVAVRAEGALISSAVPARATGWVTAGLEYEATITRADVPGLADTQGRFLIEVQATDWLGNVSMALSGCWEHRPLSAQPWVSEAREATGPDSLHAVGLEPVNNLAPLLNGVGLAQGKALMEFEVRNGTDDPIYLTLDYAQPVASYRKTWIETFTMLYEITTRDDTCLISPATCPESFPPEAVTTPHPEMPGTIVNLIGGVRVWDISGELPSEVLPCEGCDSTEYRLEPRRASGEPRAYRVALLVTALPELAPKLDAEPPAFYADLALHPIHQPTEITGVLMDGFRRCIDPRGMSCYGQKVYQVYRALTEAIITMTSFEVIGRLSPTGVLDPIRPFPQPSTFGDPLRMTDVEWVTAEGPLPGPDSP